MASHRRPAAPSRTRTRISALTVVAATSVGLATQSAQAAPQPSTSQLKSQLDQLNGQADKAIEAYNQAQAQQQQLQQKVSILQDEIARNQAKANQLLDSVGAIAQSQYASGAVDPTVQLMLTSNPGEFLQKASSMNQLTSNEASQLNQLQAEEDTLAKEKAEAEQELQALQALTQKAQALKNSAAAKVKATQKLLDSATASQRTALVGGTGSNLHYGGAAGDSIEAAAFAAAQTKIGSPYHWGSTGPSEFDCSGFMMWSYEQAGYQLGRDTYAQMGDGTPVASVSDLRVGDLVFFNGGEHVGMYAGNGIVLHAPHTGAVVRYESISTIGSIYMMRHI
ncbi:C40 family peptidase [Streptacidiphilus anmyonensis]|uniref:C40 family peptidase n=1 Tax=Streptacidiphilus anmyonensis TaxID=405782 RepID=UPI0005A644E5|nr:NlpC/P60 family protein [Streptacidiphilus anmyonensis]